MAEPLNKSPRRASLPIWWIASLIFHALLFGWLIFFSPVRVIDLAAKPTSPAANVSPARAAQVMEQVREQQAATLAGEVRALEEVRRELSQLEARKRDELRLASTNSPSSVEKIATAQDNATKAQASAEAALKRVNTPLPAGQPELSALTNVTAAVHVAQAGAGQFQAEALEALALAEPKFEPAYQAQAEANTAQARAAQAQAEAEGQLSGAAALRAKNAPKADDLEEAKDMLRTAESQLAAALSNSVSLSSALPQLRANAGAAKTAADAALAGNDKAQASAAKKRASETQKAADNAQKNLTRAQSDIPKFQQRITEQTARVAKFSGKGGAPGTNPELMERGATEKLADAQHLQTEAVTAQARASKVFAEVRSGVAAAPVAAAQKPEDLAGLYQAAVKTEAELAETYRRLRATELAMARQIPLARALELTDVARTARPDLAVALRGSAANGADVASQRQAVLDARSEIGAMRSLADSMLARARGLGAGVAQQQTLEQLAAEDDNQRAKDLTGAMRSGAGAGKGTAGTSSGRAGNGSGRTGSGGGAVSGGSGSSVAGGGGVGSGPGSGGSGDGTSSGPPEVQKDLAALPGRVIGAGAVAGRWMFVDSWYLLGPFDNTGRANIEKQFPPETVVDLNATYVGKRGRPVRWEFHQAAQPRIVPPFDNFNPLPSGATDGGDAVKSRDLEYIIYYGCTELRAVEECDVWIAVGSDDFSKLWIEDQLVWASGKGHKKWRVDEGFRKVHLKQGVNRVLFRVENGHAQTEFSLAVCASAP